MTDTRKLLALVAGISSLAIAGCDPSNSTRQLTDLKDTSWKVVAIPKQVRATMSFGADDRVFGSSGCNRYVGTYETSGQEIKISKVSSTRMMCPEVEMSVERELLKTLAIVNRWQGTANEVELTAPVNKTSVRLTRAQ
ncbi:MAG: META domain-containing protein [Hyphomicrobiaceae bacterium]